MEFERFGACVRVTITTRFLYREARDLWLTLEPSNENATLPIDSLLRALPPPPATSPRNADGDDDKNPVLVPPACLEARVLRDALQQLPENIKSRPFAVDDLMLFLLSRAAEDIHDCRKKLSHVAFDRPAEYESVMPYDTFVHKTTLPTNAP